MEIEQRIEREKQFHDRRYGDGNQRKQQVGKFYSITGSITKAYKEKVLANSKNSEAIEYGCGEGSYAVKIAKSNAKKVTGIDISPVALENARKQAELANVEGNIDFKIANAEHLELEFDSNSQDLIFGSGILHHLDLDLAVESIVQTLKPDGKAIFLEPLGHNFLINLYRRLTPNIRSEDEHPLLSKDLKAIASNFQQSKVSYFYLTSLGASLIAGKPGFKLLFNICNFIDSILLKIPGIKQQAWMVLIELEQPIK